jgi:arylmalonate decarboxylase
MKSDRTVALVVPTMEDTVPAEAAVMYPGVKFIAKGVGVRALNPEGYDQAFHAILPAAQELARNNRLDALMVFGTSLTFYRGHEAHDELLARLRDIGLPVGTMSSAIVEGLRAINARRITVATAYTDKVNRRLEDFLVHCGFEVLAIEGFGIEKFNSVASVGGDEIMDLAVRVNDRAPHADGMLISCGGLKTLDISARLEEKIGKPIVSSMPAALWSAVRLIGESGALTGHGRLFEVAH